jgi:hypothetical protein
VKGNFTIYTCTVGICSGYQNHPRPKATNSWIRSCDFKWN